MTKKYKLLRRKTMTIEHNGEILNRKLRQIQALVDIPRYGVKAGDLGGFVSAPDILSHEGDAWIGGNAKIAYSPFPIGASRKIVVKDNALISGNVQISRYSTGNDFIVGGEAHILGDICISINRDTNDDMVIDGNSSILGKMKIVDPEIITDQAKISGDGIFINENLCMRDKAEISGGGISIGCSLKMSGEAKILDEVDIGNLVAIGGESVIGKGVHIDSYRTVVNERINLTGDSWRKVGTSWVNTNLPPIPKESIDYITRQMKVAREITASSPSLAKSIKQLAVTKEDIASYETDIIKLLKYPVMIDLTDNHTLDMKIALEDVEMISSQGSPEEFIAAVNNLRKKFLIAESNARKIASSLVSADGKDKLETARKMFSIASNDASSETDKKNAFQQGFKKLEGVIAVPDSAVDAFRVKIGLAEIEA